jgi:hypothetical protein
MSTSFTSLLAHAISLLANALTGRYVDIRQHSTDWDTHTHTHTQTQKVVIRVHQGKQHTESPGQDNQGIGVRFPTGADFSSVHIIQTGPGSHTASDPMVPVFFPGVMRLESEADHSSPFRAEVENA